MIDIESYFTSLKAKWISRIQTNSRPWVAIPLHFVNCIASFKVFSEISFQTIQSMPILESFSPFYQEVFIAFSKCKPPMEVIDKQTLLQQPIWGYQNCLLKNKCLYSEHLIDD